MHYDTEADRTIVKNADGTIASDVLDCPVCDIEVPTSEAVEVAIGEFDQEMPAVDRDWLANVAMTTPNRTRNEVPPVLPMCSACAADLGYVGPVGLDGAAPEPSVTRRIRLMPDPPDNPIEVGRKALLPLAVGLWIGFWIGLQFGVWL